MANTYTQIYVQIVFAVKGRKNLISENIRDSVEKYMCGIISNNSSKPLAIYCNPDHTHILIGLNPKVSISEIARNIKANSSKWINENKLIPIKFRWQEGYGAFTYSKSQINNVVKYILNQPQHHKKTSFKNEYIKTLQKYDIEYNEEYLFEWHN